MNESDTDPALDPELLTRLLSAARPVDPPDEVRLRMRDTLLRRASRHEPLKVQNAVTSSPEKPFSSCEALISVRADESEWEALGPGLEVRTLYRSESFRAILLRMRPGAVLPPHEHDEDEECLVVDGEAFVDGLRMSKGAFHIAPRGVPHCEITTEDGALLYIRSGSLR